MANKIFKIALPWLFNLLGGTKLLSRILHVPDLYLDAAAGSAQSIAGLDGVLTPAQAAAFWRAVEVTQQQIVSAGIVTQ